MLEGLINDLPTHGPWGILAAILVAGNVMQWRQAIKERRQWFDQSVETTAALVELTVFVRKK